MTKKSHIKTIIIAMTNETVSYFVTNSYYIKINKF